MELTKFIKDNNTLYVVKSEVGYNLKHTLHQQSIEFTGKALNEYRRFQTQDDLNDYIAQIYRKLVRDNIEFSKYFEKDFTIKFNRTGSYILFKDNQATSKSFLTEDDAREWFDAKFASLSKSDQDKINNVYYKAFNKKGRGPEPTNFALTTERYIDYKLDSYDESWDEQTKARFWNEIAKNQKNVINYESTEINLKSIGWGV